MRKKVLVYTITAALSFGVGFLGFNYESSKQEFVSVSAEWSTEAKTVSEMFLKSDLVVIGKANAKKDKNNKDMTIQPFKFDNSIIYTEYDVNIKTVLKGQENLSNIEVINYGGTNTDGEIVEWEGIENFNKGEIYLLFLEKIGDNTGLKTDLRSGKYRPIDGPAGTYVIKSKDIQALKKLNEKKTLSLNELTGQDLSLEVEEVQLNIQKEILSHGMDFIINESKKYK